MQMKTVFSVLSQALFQTAGSRVSSNGLVSFKQM